jgi:hypothetical protein
MSHKLKTGDRVICTNWGSRPGVIVKMAKMTALVRLDRSCSDTRESIDSLRAETAADVAKRAREVAMDAWQDARPRPKLAHVDNASYSSEPAGASVYLVRTPDDMREAARELLLLADWFANRPVDQ